MSKKENKIKNAIIYYEGVKECSTCHIIQPKINFHRCPRETSGLYACCKFSRSEKRRAKYLANKKEKIILIPDFKFCPGCFEIKGREENGRVLWQIIVFVVCVKEVLKHIENIMS